jgi:NitT/TauT family transport system ATP-binding protein
MTVELCNIGKRFEDNQVLKNVSVTLSDTSPTCFMGPSGCGKTTLGNIVLGLVSPDEGNIIDFPGRRNSAVFQDDRLIEGRSAVENVRLACPRGVSREEILHHLAQLDLDEESCRIPVRSLSGGMRRRVALVRAVMHPSDLLLLDEPFSGLDDLHRSQAIDYIRRRLARRILVLITHNLLDAEALDTIILHLAPN